MLDLPGRVLWWGQNAPSHINPSGWPVVTARPKSWRTQSTADNFGCCRRDEKALFRRRDGATASCHPSLRPGSLPASPGVPDQPRSLFPSRKPRQDLAQAGLNALITRSLSWAGPTLTTKPLLPPTHTPSPPHHPPPQQPARFKDVISGVITTAATLIKPTGIRSRETLPVAGRLQQRARPIPRRLRCRYLRFIMEPFFALFNIFPASPLKNKNYRQADPLPC